jgi:hypothetical protein
MAKDVKFLITANIGQAEKEIRRLQSTGQSVSDSLSKSFEALGIKSSASFDAKRQAAQTAYERIKTSGTATNDELARAQQALGQRMISIDEEQFGKRTSLLNKFKANWMATTAVIGGAWLAVTQAWGLAGDAAKGLEQRQSFANLAASHGQSAQSIISNLQAVSGQTISTRVLIEKAGTAMTLGIPADKLSGLMEVARASSKVTGQSVTKAFEDISLATARGSRLILDNLGIIISEEAAYKTFAAQVGKTANQLTDAEKKTAFLNATLAAGQDIIKRVGNSGETMAEKMQRIEASMANMREGLGRGVLAILLLIDGALRGTAAAALMLSAGIFKVISAAAGLVGARGAMQEYEINARAAFEASMDLGQQGQKALADGLDVVTGRIDPLNSKMQAMSNETKLAAEAAEKLAEAKRTAADGLAAYAKEVEKLGSNQMKAAQTGFSADLKHQADLFKTNGTLAANMAAPVQQYMAVADQVFGKQLELQRQIGQALFKIGAEQKVIAQQNIQIATTEKTAAESRLGAWQQYYDNLRAMHSSAMADMQKSQADLLNIRLTTGDLVNQVQQKMMSPMQQYYAQVQQLEEKQRLAQQLGTEERIRLLQQVQQQWSGLSSEIREGDQVALTQAEAAATAVNKIQQIGAQLEAEKSAQISRQQEAVASLQASMDQASAMVSQYQARVQELDATIAALTRTFSLDINDNASPSIRAIKSELDQLRDKQITITSVYRQVYAAAPAEAMGSFASGTDYVPRTGMYLLHRGEEVRNSARVTSAGAEGKSAADSYTFTGNIILPNVTNQTSARELFAEFKKYAGRQAA